MLIINHLKVNTKVNKFCQRSTSLVMKDLKVNINVIVAGGVVSSGFGINLCAFFHKLF